eukprot:1129634-Alexandrium_andersonii.AAC.1
MQWRMSVVGEDGEQGLASFWANARRDPWAQSFPELPDHPEHGFAALLVHAEGMEVFKNTEYNVWSFSTAHAA